MAVIDINFSDILLNEISHKSTLIYNNSHKTFMAAKTIAY